MNTNNSFGKKIKKLRAEQGLTLNQVAIKTGITESFISYLEKGTRNPSKDVVFKLANALLPVDDRESLDDLLIAANLLPTNLEILSVRKDLISIYEERLETNPKDYRTFTLFIMALFKTGKYEKAKEQIEKGFTIFKDSVQLLSLLSHLELIKGNYETAIVNINAAIENYKLKTDKEKEEISLKLYDFILNLGTIYFTRGSEHSANKFKAEQEGNTELANRERELAIQDLWLAKETYEQALKLSPDDVYILDEYARVNFNLGYFDDKRENYWDKTIRAYAKVIHSEKNYEMGSNELIESCVFYAHALTKNGEYNLSELLLDVISICKPDYWLVHYIKACHYSLQFNDVKDKSLLDKALKHLKRAMETRDSYNRTQTEATYDPDLKNVREYRKKEFVAMSLGVKSQDSLKV